MKHIVKKHIAIRARPEEVWDALTNPEKTRKYFFGCRVSSSWKNGAPITFKGKILWIIPITLRGKIIETEPNKLLKYSLHNSGERQSESIVTDHLHYEKGVTTLTITDDVGSGQGAEKRYARSVKGWEKVLRGLKELVEGE